MIVEKVAQAARIGSEYLPTRQDPSLSPPEKAEQLWGLFNDYSTLRRKLYREGIQANIGGRRIREIPQDEKDDILARSIRNPLAQRLVGEISCLWQDLEVRGVFVLKVQESLGERQIHDVSLRKYRKLKSELVGLEDENFDLLRNQFLMHQMTPTLRAIDLFHNRVAKDRVKKNIDDLETTGGMAASARTARGGLDREHADLTALLAFERLVAYHREFKLSGIILTPSRQELLGEVVTKTAAETWIQLVGETGTGKSTFAKRTSHILNGEPPQYASGEKWGDARALIGTKTMEGSRVYFDFGPLVYALTGCQNSLEMEEAIKTRTETPGKILQLDELNKFDQDALMGVLNIVSTLRPGEIFNFKELPGIKLRKAKRGFAIIATMNPASVRYDRKELDPSTERRFYDGKEKVDYPPMTAQEPELYEIFLAVLLDDNGRIRIAEQELAPAFNEVRNTATGMIKYELDSDVKKHGALYRFSLAATEIHKSFTQKSNVAKTATSEGFLEKTVLDMEVLVKWMEGYRAQIEGGDSLAAYLDKKIHDFYTNIESANDKVIFERIFNYFGFNITNPRNISKPLYHPLTPIEIGYLTPKTPRLVRRTGEEVTPKTKLYINPRSGEEITYLSTDVEIEAGKKIRPGEIISLRSKQYLYLGIHPETKEIILILQQ